MIDNYVSIINIIIIILFICYILFGLGMVCIVMLKVVMILNFVIKIFEIKLKMKIVNDVFII